MKADNDSSVTLKNDDIEQLSLKLAMIAMRKSTAWRCSPRRATSRP